MSCAPRSTTAFEKWQSVVQDAARERWAQTALRLGIPLPLDALSVDEATACHLPVYVTILRQRDSRRVVVIDGGDGTLDEPLSAVLTANLGLPDRVSRRPGALAARRDRPLPAGIRSRGASAHRPGQRSVVSRDSLDRVSESQGATLW